MTDMTYALWGNGDLTPESAKALLEEYIPDNVGTVFRPIRVPRGSGLRTALDWFEVPTFLGENGAVPSDDLIQSLIDERDGQYKDEVYLLALVPENPTHEDIDFLELAQNSGITVFDLSRALDEVDLTLPCYSRPAPTAEEKAEAKAAAAEVKRGRGRPKKEAAPEGEAFVSPTLEAAATTEVVQTEPLYAPEAEEAVVHAAVPTEGDYGPVEIIEPNVNQITPEFVGLALASMNLMEALDKYVEAKVEMVLANLGVRFTPPAVEAALDKVFEKTRPAEDEPPFDGPYTKTTVPVTETKEYYKSPMGTYRPAPSGSKPKRGEVVEELTDAQAKAYEKEGLLTPF